MTFMNPLDSFIPNELKALRALHHESRWALAVLSVALLFVGVSFWWVGGRVLTELEDKDFEVAALIEELGEVQQENFLLSQKMNNGGLALRDVQMSVDDLERHLSAVDIEGAAVLSDRLMVSEKKLNDRSQALSGLLSTHLTRDLSVLVEADETLDVLILGTHGRLTDTILLASINEAKKSISLFSLPRDLAVNGRRINEVYSRFGVDTLRKEVEKITGLYPERYVVLDMALFESVIDVLGGIDVRVEKPLIDYSYPGPNYTYSIFSVEAGLQHFDGVTALKYARSRKSTSDFDRALRQQAIVEAVRDRVVALNLVTDAGRLVDLYSAFTKGVDMNFNLSEVASLAKTYSTYSIQRGHVLTSSNYLQATTGTNGAYLLLPRDGSYAEIRQYIAEVVAGGGLEPPTPGL